jgi:hypothetical protein
VVRAVRDHADADPVRGVGAGEGVDDVEVTPVEMSDDLRAQPVEIVLLDRLVDGSPPDPVLGVRLPDDELVLRRATGEAAGVDDERAALRELPLAARERMRVEQGGRRLPVDAAVGVEPVSGERGLGGDRDREASFSARNPTCPQ